MKLLLLPIVLAFFILSADAAFDKTIAKVVRRMVKSKLETCAEENKATKANVAEVMNFTIPASHEGKCMLFCASQKFKGQNADGSTNLKGVLKSIKYIGWINKKIHKKITTILTTCDKTPDRKDPCDFAADIVACLMKEAKKVDLDKLIIEQ